jgi:ABC-2 type transport system ATP-binding protein
MIEVSNLSKSYGRHKAVDGISFKVEAGEIYGFLGVNGAGKTSTIRMMVGIIQPTAGSIKLGGFDIIGQPEQAKSITGYIPDRPYIYPKLTGREFLSFSANLYKVPKKEIALRVGEILEKFALTEWADELVESYSHGMKQRLATCASLIHKPKILIVDEPMVGLDPRGAKMFKDTLKDLANSGMCIFLSTHSLDVAEEVADRLAIIQRGRLITSGTLDEIRSNAGLFESALETIFLELTSEPIYTKETNIITE